MRFQHLGGLAALLLLPFATSGAQAPAARKPSLGVVIEGALEAGGDRFVETFFTNGESQTMRAGQGGTFAVGGEIRPHAASPLALRATAGIKFVTTAASNADIHLTRIPIELVGSYTFPRGWRAGAGYVRHSRIRFEGDELGPDVKFDDAQGFTVEAGWRWAALTLTRIDYTDEFGNDYDAGSVGLSLSWVWRPRGR